VLFQVATGEDQVRVHGGAYVRLAVAGVEDGVMALTPQAIQHQALAVARLPALLAGVSISEAHGAVGELGVRRVVGYGQEAFALQKRLDIEVQSQGGDDQGYLPVLAILIEVAELGTEGSPLFDQGFHGLAVHLDSGEGPLLVLLQRNDLLRIQLLEVPPVRAAELLQKHQGDVFDGCGVVKVADYGGPGLGAVEVGSWGGYI
jgi:hypothetical protein